MSVRHPVWYEESNQVWQGRSRPYFESSSKLTKYFGDPTPLHYEEPEDEDEGIRAATQATLARIRAELERVFKRYRGATASLHYGLPYWADESRRVAFEKFVSRSALTAAADPSTTAA